MSVDITITRKEAFLLGMCLGNRKEENRYRCFSRRLRDYVRDFSREFDHLQQVQVHSDQLPIDIKWSPDGMLGASPETPNVLYEKRERIGHFVVERDANRKSRFDLVIRKYAHLMELSKAERLFYTFLKQDPYPIGTWKELVGKIEDGDPAISTFTEVGKDEPALCEKLSDLAQKCDCQEFFLLGQYVSFFELGVDLYVRELIDTSRSSFWQTIEDLDSSDTGACGVQQYYQYAVTKILEELTKLGLTNADRGFQKMDRAYFQVEKGEVDRWWLLDDCIREALEVRSDATRAIATLIGALAQLDDREAAFGEFTIEPNDTPHKVRKKLARVEKQLSKAPFDHDVPDDAVARLSCAPENLSKQMWPEEFKNAKPSLKSVLTNKLYLSNTVESRFASIALTVYLSYRNPSQHDPDQFDCSMDEARFYAAAIRALLDLWERSRESAGH